MTARAKLAAILLVVAAAFLLATATRAAAPAKWIVFSAVPPGEHVDQLFRIHVSGSGLAKLTTGQLPSIDPAFSPDGKRIAFARTGVGIVTMDVNGKSVHRLTTNARDSYPAWSPDGKQIAFVRPTSAKWAIYVMPSAGGRQRPLTKAPPAGRPTWSSRGLMIPTGGDLAKISPANGNVLKYFGAEIDAVWGLNTVALSPDGSRLTFIGAAAPDPGDKECGEGVPCQRFALYMEDILPRTKPPKLLIKNVGPATFSPDGKQLAFVQRNTKLDLRTVAGGHVTALPLDANYATTAAPPAWQP